MDLHYSTQGEIINKDIILEDLKKGAKIHRKVRKYAREILKPGVDLLDFCNKLENKTRELTKTNEKNNGIGFPTGVSINECAAHFTPTIGDKITVNNGDVIKVDFGTHVNGRIIDSAFTVTFDNKYDTLVEAAKAATNIGIKEAGIGVRLGELGEKIQEVMESYEIELDGKTIPIKPVRNLGGHSIEPYHIHAGKYIPCIKTNDNTKMEEGEIYAVETFATTGSGIAREREPTSHFMKKDNINFTNLKFKASKKLLGYINNNFGTLPFCDKWLYCDNKNYKFALEDLCKNNIIQKYPPLYDIKNSYIAQFEHTIYLKSSGKEVISKGNDY
jgi:methionyl aminopeptidase